MVFTGYDVKIIMPKFVEDTATGDGTTTDFVPSSLGATDVIVDTNGDQTVDSKDVRVWVDGTYQKPDTDYTLLADKRTISFTTAPGAGTTITFKYGYGPKTVARSQSISYEVSKPSEEIPLLGKTEPFIKAGRKSITGSLEILLQGRENFEAIGADIDFTPKFEMTVEIGSPPAKIKFTNTSFETLGGEFPMGDVITESLDFRAEKIEWVS